MKSVVAWALAILLAMSLAPGAGRADTPGEQCRWQTRYEQPLRVLYPDPVSYLALFQDKCGGRFIARCYRESGRCVDLTNRPEGQICRIVGGVYSCIATSGHNAADDALSECLRRIDLSGDPQALDAAVATCAAKAG